MNSPRPRYADCRIGPVWVPVAAFFCLSLAAVELTSAADDSDVKPKPFRQMLVGTLGLPEEPFLSFVERVRPDVVVMGAFGAPQWAAQKNPAEWLRKWRGVFQRMHRSNVKVVGMIELLNVGDSAQDARRFLDFYNHRWDERILGERPSAAGESLLERRLMPVEEQVGAHAPRGCAVNPHWRAVEKAFVKALIDAGIDGFITHRNMFGECVCPFCHAELNPHHDDHASPKHKQARGTPDSSTRAPRVGGSPCEHCGRGFRRWLADRYDAGRLKSRYGITDLKSHRFEAIYGHHRDHARLPTPIQLEGMKFARHTIKACFDDVLVEFGRGLKNDLIVAQWNHMPYFDELHLDRGHIPPNRLTTFAHASADERWSLPIDLWGRGETFYWYCNWGTCQNTQLDKRFVADVTLYAKLLRSFAGGKPYVINKYDFYRPRNMLAEAAALGMIAGAKDVPYRAPEDADTMARHLGFLRRHGGLFANNNGETVADVLLVYPRTLTHEGDASGLEMVEAAGRSMIVDHVQFDFLPDDLLSDVDLAGYRAVVTSSPAGLKSKRLSAFYEAGGTLIAVPRDERQAADPKWRDLRAHVVKGLPPHSGASPKAAPFVEVLGRALGNKRARFAAPYTVETHVYRQKNRLVVHLVNYDHKEKATGRSVVEREAPLAADPVGVRLPLAGGLDVKKVAFLDPDRADAVTLRFQQDGAVVSFKTPSFLVYGICVLELQ